MLLIKLYRITFQKTDMLCKYIEWVKARPVGSVWLITADPRPETATVLAWCGRVVGLLKYLLLIHIRMSPNLKYALY